MPLTSKGEKILENMKEQYGPEKGEQVFYASVNKGNITGVDNVACHGYYDPYQIPTSIPKLTE